MNEFYIQRNLLNDDCTNYTLYFFISCITWKYRWLFIHLSGSKQELIPEIGRRRFWYGFTHEICPFTSVAL